MEVVDFELKILYISVTISLSFNDLNFVVNTLNHCR